MTVEMTDIQFERLIAMLQGGGGGGAAGAAALVGPMGPCLLGKDKLKRPKKWSDWKKDAENKMRFIRSCTGAELTEIWEKEVRARFEAKVEEVERVEVHTYEQVVEDTKQTLLKLVSKDRAIMDLLGLEQGNRGFMDYLAEVEDQTHLCHNWENLTGDDMKRISLLGGIRDRTLAEKAMAEEYTQKQLIQAAVNRESFKANAEALQAMPTGNVNRLIKVEEPQRWGSNIDARIGHLQAELEDVKKMLKGASTAVGTRRRRSRSSAQGAPKRKTRRGGSAQRRRGGAIPAGSGATSIGPGCARGRGRPQKG